MSTITILTPADFAARDIPRMRSVIRMRYRAGDSIAFLADDYQVTEATIRLIVADEAPAAARQQKQPGAAGEDA